MQSLVLYIIIIINIQPLSRFWQEPEPNQVTGMALARCILGKFLGLVFHCFPLSLDVFTFAARCLHVPNNASAPISERWNRGRELCPVILPKLRIYIHTYVYECVCIYMRIIYAQAQILRVFELPETS
jgi:hypothetical protein